MTNPEGTPTGAAHGFFFTGMAGALAAFLFVPLSEVFWSGNGFSLIIPQLVTLGPALAVVLKDPGRRAEWLRHTMVVATVFYGTWGVVYLLYNLVSPPVHG